MAPGWRRLLPSAAGLGRRAAAAALASAGPPGRAAELCLVLADDATARRLNRAYRGVDRPTNVLSFGGYDDPLLGDVVLARETVAAEAKRQGKSPASHFSHLVVHGVLHLLGYDHARARDAARMERLEVDVLAGLGIADPYGRESGQR